MTPFKTMKRLALSALLLLPLPAPAPAQTPEEDRGYIQGFLEDALSDAGRAVTITGFAGALSSRATIDEMTIADEEGIWLTLSGVTLDWSRAALLSGRVEINALTADAITIPRAPVTPNTPDAEASEAAGTGFALPELPVSVRIDTLEVTKLTLGAPLLGTEATARLSGNAALSGGEGTANLNITRTDKGGKLTLKGGYANATRKLDIALALSEPANGIAATLIGLPGTPALDLTLLGSDPLSDFTATLQLATEGQERLAGTLTLLETQSPLPDDAPEGTQPPVTREIKAELGGDLAPVFAPQYRPFFGPDIRLKLDAATLPDGTMLLSRLDLQADALDLQGAGAIAADGWPLRLDLRGHITPVDGADSVLLPVGTEETRIKAADLNLTYDAAQGDTLALDILLAGLDHPQARLARAVLTGRGTLARGGAAGAAVGGLDMRVDLGASGLALADPSLASAIGDTLTGGLDVKWQEKQPFRLSNIALRGADYGLGGELIFRATTDPANLTVLHDITLDAQNLSRFAPLAGTDLAGAADLRLFGKAEPLTGLIDTRISGTTTGLSLAQPRLDPLLRGKGDLKLALTRDADGTRVEGLHITTDLADITADANLRTDASTARVTAEIKDLSPIEPRLNGPATLTAQADQSGQVWTIASTLAAPGQTSATLNATLTTSDAQPVSATLNASIGQLGPWSALAGQTLKGGAKLDATVDAQLSDLSGSIDATLRGDNLGLGNSTIDPLLAGASSLKLRASRNADGKLLLELAEARTNALSADITGSVTDTTTALTLDARMGNIGLIVPEISGPATLTGTARNSGGPWQLDLNGTGPAGIRLAANGSVAQNAGSANIALDGTVPLALANDALAPRSLAGFADFDLRVNGPLALSSVSGRVVTRDARLAAPGLRVALQDLAATVTLGGGRANLDLSAGVSSGGGLAITGPVTLSAPYNAALTVQLNDLVLTDPELYQTSIAGALTINGALTGGAAIRGTLKLGETDLRIPSGSGSGYAGLPGLKHRNEPFEVRRTRDWAGLIDTGPASNSGPSVAYPIDVTVVADSRIFVRGRGLDAELGGRLRVTGTTANVTPVGRFDLIRGRLDVLGKRFDLTEGRAQLQGALDPWVRFVAETEASGTTVRIIIEGQASSPNLTFESSPTLPQDEVLSLILFERNATEISPLQAIRLASAIRTLSGKGGAGLVGNLRSSLALDDLDVTTAEDGTTEARVGKYLSDKVYTDVTVNSEGKSQINLNLKINPRLKVRGRASSDGDTGIGVYFEKDY